MPVQPNTPCRLRHAEGGEGRPERIILFGVHSAGVNLASGCHGDGDRHHGQTHRQIEQACPAGARIGEPHGISTTLSGPPRKRDSQRHEPPRAIPRRRSRTMEAGLRLRLRADSTAKPDQAETDHGSQASQSTGFRYDGGGLPDADVVNPHVEEEKTV